MLEIELQNVSYGKARVLFGVSCRVRRGSVTCLMGRNGAGKTTSMKAVMGLLPVISGSVLLDSHRIDALPAYEIPRRGIALVPQGRRLFGDLTVDENFQVGLMARKRGHATRERVLDIFPKLRERLKQRAKTLSGGEQQMLATARALCVEPDFLLLDEPTEGLQPSMTEQIRDVIKRLRDEGVGILLVEQRPDAAINIADRVVFLENGKSKQEVDAKELSRDPALLYRYVGV